MGKRTYKNTNNQEGFTLWELSIVMLIMIGLFVALVNIIPYIVKRDNIQLDKQVVVKLDQQLLGFIATYNRLPCPDSNANGEENCIGGTSSGSIPYKTLGLNEDYAGIGSIPIQYAVFRNTASMADLTNITDLFNPTDSHGTTTTLNNVNGLDFCTALTNGKTSTFSSAFAHIILPDGSAKAVPYVIVTAGLSSKDGGTTTFDGRNATASMDFEPANKPHNAGYDDTVYSKSFDELASTLNCDTAQNSLNLLADAKATHSENVTQQASLKDSADLAIIITIAQTALGIANTAMAIFNLVTGVAVVIAASAYLSITIAACIASLGTACGAVVSGIAALVAAVVAIVLAGVSVALNIAAVIIQIIAVVRLVDVAKRAGSTGVTDARGDSIVEVPDPSASSGGTSYADMAVDARNAANDLKAQVVGKTLKARDDIYATLSLGTTIRNRFNGIKNLTQSLANFNTAVGDATFSFYSNAANNEAQSNINRANNAIGRINSAKTEVDNAVVDLGTPPAYTNINFANVDAHLLATDSHMTSASNSFTDLKNNYLTIKNRATIARNRLTTLINISVNRITVINGLLNQNPPPAEADTAAERNALIAERNTLTNKLINTLYPARAKAIDIINNMNAVVRPPTPPFDPNGDPRNLLEVEIGTQLGRILAAKSAATEASETISAAIDADANATYMEDNISSGNPLPTTTTLGLSLGVDAILRKADEKGVER
jgi:type II secretory pathway pseudopilin PulG